MVAVIVGLKYIFKHQELNLYLQLATFLTAGALSYLLIMGLTARSLCRQVLELIRLAFPSWNLKKT
jgi:hypothetical protein